MSSWNYRMTVHTVEDSEFWELREIYYDEAGNVTSWTKEPAVPYGETWLECNDVIARMTTAAVTFPILDLDTRTWVNRKRQPYDGRPT